MTSSLLNSPGLFSVFWPTSVIWMVSIRPLSFKSSSLFINPLVTTKSTHYNWDKRHFHVPQFFFSSLVRSTNSSFFLFYFDFSLWSAAAAKSTIQQALFFFVDYHKVLSFGRDSVIHLNVKIAEEFVWVILQG